MRGKASATPRPTGAFLAAWLCEDDVYFFCFFTLCCKFALNEYGTGIILEHVIASQPKPPSSLPAGPPGPGYQADRISHPGGPGSCWGWAARPGGFARALDNRERSPSLQLAGQGALPRFSEVHPSTRLPACGPAPSEALALSHALCPGGPHVARSSPRLGPGLVDA